LVTGYVFIDAEKGRALEVVSEVVKIKGVKTACAVTGTFDVIATFEVISSRSLLKILLGE